METGGCQNQQIWKRNAQCLILSFKEMTCGVSMRLTGPVRFITAGAAFCVVTVVLFVFIEVASV